jgi:hypothetical protein
VYETIIIAKQDEIDALNAKVEEYQNKFIEMAERPTTNVTNNVLIQSLQPLTEQHMLDHVSNLTIEDIEDGATGYAEYALKGPFKDRLVCVDWHRKKVKYKDAKGNVVTDPELTKLTKRFFSNIEIRNNELISDFIESLEDPGDSLTSFEDSRAKKFRTYKDLVSKGAQGKPPTAFHKEFTKHVCKHTLV